MSPESTVELHERSTSAEEEPESRRERVRRLSVMVAATAIALAIMLVLITVSQSGVHDIGGNYPTYTPRQLLFQFYSRIPQQGTKLGSPGAPYRMIEYVDLQCPFCAQYSIYVLPPLLRRYVRTRRVQLEMRPIAALGKDSAVAARALFAAGEENRLWQFADLFYRNQGEENSGYVTPELLRLIARQGSLSPSTVVAAARSPIQPPALLRNSQSAKRLRVTGTPTFFLGRRGGGPLHRLKVTKLEAPPFLADLKTALKRL